MNPRSFGGRSASLAKRGLRLRPVAGAVRRIAALRGRGLVLVYHRVDDDPRPDGAIVPSIPVARFRRQLEVLGEMGEIVPLRILLDGRRSTAPRFALTFDDDLATHVDRALPILRDRGVSATFFLSGRALHGLGPYWFELLERLIDTLGIDEVGRLANAPGLRADELVIACEDDASLRDTLGTMAIETCAGDLPPGLDRAGIEALVGAGMTIGFHTLHHEVLTHLDDDGLHAALTRGREELEAVVRALVTLLAYPHGRADRRVATEARAVGFEAAWTGRPSPMGPRDDRYLLGRWEPGPLDVDDFVAATAVRLARGART